MVEALRDIEGSVSSNQTSRDRDLTGKETEWCTVFGENGISSSDLRGQSRNQMTSWKSNRGCSESWTSMCILLLILSMDAAVTILAMIDSGNVQRHCTNIKFFFC